MELGNSAMMRRDRLERIATAERDRRAGRTDVAIASLGEPTEWPARVVLALARLPEQEAAEARRILMEGLDVWAEEAGLDPLDPIDETDSDDDLDSFPDTDPDAEAGSDLEVDSDDSLEDDLAFDADVEVDFPLAGDGASDLDRPIDQSELEQAFAAAEAQTDEMHDVNEVAERVLMSESAGLASLAGDDLVSSSEPMDDRDAFVADVFGMDAASVPASTAPAEEADTAIVSHAPTEGFVDTASSDAIILATLTQWLRNLEEGKMRRAV